MVKGNSLNQEGSADIYEQIISLPFIRPLDQGRVAFHDLTREGLLRRYAITHPELLTSAAKILAPVYLAHGLGRVSITEAFFCYIIAGQPELAVELLNTLFEEAINHEDWVYMSGLMHLQEEAEQLPFVQFLPLTEKLWIMRGITHRVQGEQEAAITDYSRALVINPKNSLTYMPLGAIYFEQGRYEEALQCYGQAIQLDPTFVQPYINRGLIYLRQHHDEEAARNFSQAIQIDPANIEAHKFLNQTMKPPFPRQMQATQERTRNTKSQSGFSSMVSKIAKAKRYAEEPQDIQFTHFEATFRGENDVHTTSWDNGQWHCTCRFFHDWGSCSHTMAMQQVLGVTIPNSQGKKVGQSFLRFLDKGLN